MPHIRPTDLRQKRPMTACFQLHLQAGDERAVRPIVAIMLSEHVLPAQQYDTEYDADTANIGFRLWRKIFALENA